MQVATINAQKYATGGLVGGRRHSQGGTMIEAEQGEYVVSRAGVESIGVEALNRINAGGGSAVNITFSGNDGSGQPFAFVSVNNGTGSLNTSDYTGKFSVRAF